MSPTKAVPSRLSLAAAAATAAVAALVLGTVAGAAGGSAAPSFAAPAMLAASLDPASVVIGDLNGDGKADLAIANSFEDSEDEEGPAGTVSVRLGRGDGTFKPRRDYQTGSGPLSVAIGDLNGDGKLDLATANTDAGSVSVLLNGGDGSFRTERDYATGESTVAVAIADLNGDGRLDLVAVVREANRVDVLLNDGDGRFAPPVAYPTGPSPSDVAVADLNGDGRPDVVTADDDANTVSVLLNDGAGAFASNADYPAGAQPIGIAVGDLNHDGRPDLAVSHFGSVSRPNSVTVLTNDGAGRFEARRDYALAEGLGPIAIGDLNRDGNLDVVTPNDDSDRLSVLIGRGNGSFEPSLAYPTGPGPSAVAIGDVNGDGRVDLVVPGAVQDEANDVAVLLNTPGSCNVQAVVGLKPAAAKASLARAHCAVGAVGSAYSKTVRKGRVVAQRPAFGAVRPAGARVALVISRGKRR